MPSIMCRIYSTSNLIRPSRQLLFYLYTCPAPNLNLAQIKSQPLLSIVSPSRIQQNLKRGKLQPSSMATLSGRPNSNPDSISPDPSTPTQSDNLSLGTDRGNEVHTFPSHMHQNPNPTVPATTATTNPNFLMPMSPPPPPPIRTSLKPPASLSLSSSLTDGFHTQAPTIQHLSFNQDYGCFAAATDRGFRIYNCDPFREIFRRDFDRGGGIGTVEMLFRCNILALVGGGPEPQYPVNKVMLWDDHQSRCIGELSFRSEVRRVKLRRDRIVAVLEQKIFVYNFADLKLLHQIETISNPKGLCEVSHTGSNLVLVCPGLHKGQLRVEHYGSKRTKFITAHDSRIACFALTQDGALLATASSKGTLVRIFNTLDGTLLQEVRRGADRAEIYSLAFSPTAQWLAVSSDKGTVHVFGLKVNSLIPSNDDSHIVSEDSTSSQSGSPLSFMRGVLPKYFSSEWSVAQFRLIEGAQYIVAFGHQLNTVVILGMDGSFYRCKFDPAKGGEMTQLEHHNFLTAQEPS